MTFQIGDRVKCKEVSDVGHAGIVGRVYTIAAMSGRDITIDCDEPNPQECDPDRFELYAKAGEFVVGDAVMTVNVLGGPWTVLDVQAPGDGQRISFPGDYGQWWPSTGYRLATPDEIAAADLSAPEFSEVDPSIVIEPKPFGKFFTIPGEPDTQPQPIPAADFDFSTIKAGDRVIAELIVKRDGVDLDGDVVVERGGNDHVAFIETQYITSVVPAPKPKTLRERAIEAASGVTKFDGAFVGDMASYKAAIVDAVLAEVEKGR